MDFFEKIREIRQWIIIFICLILVIVIVAKIRTCGLNDLIQQNSQLEQEKQELLKKIQELEQKLQEKPQVETIVKEKKVTVQKCYVIIEGKRKEVDCGTANGEQVDVTITMEDCCKLGIGTKFYNDYIICRDENVCQKGDEFIELTEKGREVFKDISHSVERLDKRGFFRPALLGGYDFVSSHFLVGSQFISFSDFGFGIDFGSDFKNFKTSDIGVFGIYRPRIKKIVSNIGAGAGVGTPINNFGKGFNVQVNIMFYVIE